MFIFLPRDMREYIISFIQDIDDITSLRLVSKDLLTLVSQHTQVLTYKDNPYLLIKEEFLLLFSRLKECYIRIGNLETLERISLTCAKISLPWGKKKEDCYSPINAIISNLIGDKKNYDYTFRFSYQKISITTISIDISTGLDPLIFLRPLRNKVRLTKFSGLLKHEVIKELLDYHDITDLDVNGEYLELLTDDLLKRLNSATREWEPFTCEFIKRIKGRVYPEMLTFNLEVIPRGVRDVISCFPNNKYLRYCINPSKNILGKCLKLTKRFEVVKVVSYFFLMGLPKELGLDEVHENVKSLDLLVHLESAYIIAEKLPNVEHISVEVHSKVKESYWKDLLKFKKIRISVSSEDELIIPEELVDRISF